MSTDMPATGDLHLVVGYDGSPPAVRALDGAVRLLQGRAGDIEVVYIAHLPAVDMMSADAIVGVEDSFDEVVAGPARSGARPAARPGGPVESSRAATAPFPTS